MKHQNTTPRDHQNPQGAEYSAPYPVSRMAPSFDLINLAEEISQADTTLTAHPSGKLRLIATQIKALQDEARQVLDQTQQDLNNLVEQVSAL